MKIQDSAEAIAGAASQVTGPRLVSSQETAGAHALHDPLPAEDAGVPGAGPANFEERKAQLRTRIFSLPQAGVLSRSHVENWIDHMLSNFSYRECQWHVRRLGGFGGSEIAALVKHRKEIRDPFTSARNLVLQKLLILPPENPTIDTVRGHRAEAYIREQYARSFGFQRRPDISGSVSGRSHSRHSWLFGQPDDTGICPDSMLWLVDFKCPKARNVEQYLNEGASFDWSCQLHVYDELLSDAGHRMDRMAIALWDSDHWEVRRLIVDRDPELLEEILDTGNMFWSDYVMEGRLPDYLRRARIDFDDIPQEVSSEADRYMTIRAMKSALENQEEISLGIVKNFFSEAGTFDGRKSSIGILKIDATLEYDVESLVNMLKGLGGRPSDFRDDSRVDAKPLVKKVLKVADRARIWMSEEEEAAQAGKPAEPEDGGTLADIDLEMAEENPDALFDAYTKEEKAREQSAIEILKSLSEIDTPYDVRHYKMPEMVDEIKNLGGDPSPFVREVIRTRIPSSSQDPAKEFWDFLKERALDRIPEFIQTHHQELLDLAAAEDLAADEADAEDLDPGASADSAAAIALKP